jgi:hypothetical protein
MRRGRFPVPNNDMCLPVQFLEPEVQRKEGCSIRPKEDKDKELKRRSLLFVTEKTPGTIEILACRNLYKYEIRRKKKGLDLFGRL